MSTENKKPALPAAMQKTAALFKDYPAEQFHRLLPSLTVADVSGPLQKPHVEVVKIDPSLPERGKPGSGGGEVYQDKRLPKGTVALSRRALNKFQHAAGIIFPPQLQRMEHNKTSAFCQASGAMKKGDGSLLVVSASKIVDLEVEEAKARAQQERSNAWKAKNGEALLSEKEVDAKVQSIVLQARENMIQNAETKAQNRVIRKILALKDAYTTVELQKPFVLVRFDQVFDMSDPMQVQAALVQAETSKALLFPPSPSSVSRLLEATPPVEAVVQTVDLDQEEHVNPGTGEIAEEVDELDEAPPEEEDGPVEIIADYESLKKLFKAATAKLPVEEREKLQYSWRVVHRIQKDEASRIGAWIDLVNAAEGQAEEVQR